jgi:hypothetical protein
MLMVSGELLSNKQQLHRLVGLTADERRRVKMEIVHVKVKIFLEKRNRYRVPAS